MGAAPKGSGVGGFRGEEAFGFVARVSVPEPRPELRRPAAADDDDEDAGARSFGRGLVARTCRWAPVRFGCARRTASVSRSCADPRRGSGFGSQTQRGFSKASDEVDCSNPSRGKSIDPSIDRGLVAAAVASPDVFVGADGEREYPLLPGTRSPSSGAGRARRVSPRARGGRGNRKVGVRSLRGVPRRAEGRTEGGGVVLRPGWGPRAVLAQGAVAHAPMRRGRGARAGHRRGRLKVGDRFRGTRAHLFGLESREVLELLRGHRRAMASAGGPEGARSFCRRRRAKRRERTPVGT